MALSPIAVSLGSFGLAALTVVVIGRPSHRDWLTAEADRLASNVPALAQAVAPVPSPAKVSAAGVTLQSVNVDFPDRGTMFTGPGSDAINNNCLACHSAGMVLNQPAFPRAIWEAEIHKMINAYGAPVDNVDTAQIVDYLVKTKGTN